MLLLAIRPKFVQMIFSGTKTVELRRRQPRIKIGDSIAVYASSPRKALVGIVDVADIAQDGPAKLWRRVKLGCGLSHAEYTGYFEHARKAIGISVCNPRLLRTPLSLLELQTNWPSFWPPQCFRYLVPDEEAFLLSMPFTATRQTAAA